MRLIIDTIEDMYFLQGKFVLQIDESSPGDTLMSMNWGFAKEKRLKIVTKLGFIDLYGWIGTYDTFEDFKDVFNSYLLPYMKKEGITNGERFHRLLTSKELDYLCEQLKKENY